MLKKAAVIVIGLLVAFVIVVAIQPASFRIVRAASIEAPPSTVFSQVNNFHNWEAWSPWAKLDTGMTTTYDGPEAGIGSIYSWSGNSDVGAGRMTLTESRTNELVRIKLEFLKPFEAVNSTEFTFKPNSGKTDVSWEMTGEKNFMTKAFCLFVDMDKMVGADFEKGLSQLKAVSESRDTNGPADSASTGSANSPSTNSP